MSSTVATGTDSGSAASSPRGSQLGTTAGETSRQPRTTRPVIEIKDVGVTFRGTRAGDDLVALSDVSLTVREGEFVCLIGPSGCGKSTLLNAVVGLLPITSGSIAYKGVAHRSGVNTDVGYITQGDTLLPWRTLERNVGIACELGKVPRKERKRRVREALERVGLEGFENHYPAQLSGGMRKRAVIARTLIYEPDCLLLDEPFAAVDAQMRAFLQQDLLRIWERRRPAVVFVTHDLEEAILLADRVVVLGRDPGRVVKIADVPFDRPRDLFDLRGTPEFAALWRELWELIATPATPAGAANEVRR